MKLRTHTLGCKVNQYETEYVREGLLGIGWLDAADGEPADLCLVNTCTVTAEADAKSRRVIRRLARNNPASQIIVMGCYATRAPEEIAVLPNVTEILTDKRELSDLLGRFGVTEIPTGVSGLARRHRAYVKVQDGCLLRCSFCIIPHVRPALTSRPVDHITAEVGRLVENGYREVVLTGIHLGHYGVDWNRQRSKDQWVRLSHLVQMIAELPGDFRMRLSSIEATEVTRELLSVMAEHRDKVCPHLHISMQSGSESVLRRMKRRWGARRFIDRCRLVRETLDYPAITTDVLVGFPGETEAEFEETLAVCRTVGFSKIHIFPFSPRRGTPAAEMTDQIPPPVKKERVQRLMALEAELREAYFHSLLGRRLRVLVEGTTGTAPPASGWRKPAGNITNHFATPTHTGTSCRYAPVDIATYNGLAPTIGQFTDITAKEVVDGRIRGQ